MKRKFSFLLVAVACFCGGEVANGQSDEYMFFYAAEREKNAQLLNSTRKKAEQGDAEAQSLLSWMYSVGFDSNIIRQDKAEAAKWLRKLAEQGDAESQNNLGRVYAYGEVGPNDNVEAAKWFRKAAEQGLAQAQFNLGWMYEHGQGMPKDEVEAAKWYQKAADQGYGKQNIGYGAKAQNNLGEIFCKLGEMYENDEAEQKNNREAIACVLAAHRWYIKAFQLELGDVKVKNNYARIQYKLGEVEKGRGNRSGAWLNYQGAARLGHAEAQFKLAEMYTTGGESGRVQSYKGAAEWYRKAAEQGHAEAQYNLAKILEKGYRYGKGKTKAVPQDYEEALKWYRKAAEQGHAEAQFKFEAMQGGAEAQYNLGKRYEKGEGVTRDYEEAANWYRMAAEQGHAKAQNSLGYLYDHGKGVKENDKEAVEWFRKAAAQGYDVAQNNLGIMYANGYGVRKNDEEAAKWYRKAADQGHAKAKKNLGELYYKLGNIAYPINEPEFKGPGKSDPFLHKKLAQEAANREHYVKALRWYRKAANEGHAGAQRKIGMMYSKGRGVPKNDVEAYAWLFLAGAGEISILEKRLTARQLHNAQERATELQRLIGAK